MRPRATGFNPKSISGLAAWWDASVGITTDGNGNVSAWADQSGNGRTLAQSTANNRPAYNTNVLSGKPVVNFDGVNDAMLASFTLAQPITYLFVYRWDSAYSSGNPRALDGATGNTMSFAAVDASQLFISYGAQLNASITDAERRTFSVTQIITNGSSSAILHNGSTRTSSAPAGTASPNGIYLGVFGNGFSAPGDVSYAEMLIYSRTLTTTEAGKIRSYLGNKYGITTA
jgi:hypothetical protein